jgi:hypothetical protein
MHKEYDNTNRIVLFPTNAKNERAPSYNGFLEVDEDKLERMDNGNFKLHITMWTDESGRMNGNVKSISDREEEIAEYRARQEKKPTSKKVGFRKN